MYSPQNTKVIILAAGRGTRLGSRFPYPKPLIPINGEPLLKRTIRQLHEVGFTDMTIITGHNSLEVTHAVHESYPQAKCIFNERFSEDQNIFSLLTGIQYTGIDYPILVVEGDVIFADIGIMRLLKVFQESCSVWTAHGPFMPYHNGGILLSTDNNVISSISYSAYYPSLAHWKKNLGVIYLHPKQLPHYLDLLRIYAEKSLSYYFMTPWAEHLTELPSQLVDLGADGGVSFNTPQELDHALSLLNMSITPNTMLYPSTLLEVASLKHIEAFDPQRVTWLARKIEEEGIWTTPIACDRHHHLVMDGQHRMEAAKLLKLTRVPAVLLDYASVPVYSLRPDDYSVTVQEIINRSLQGNIYPYKTAKHRLPSERFSCSIPLKKLR